MSVMDELSNVVSAARDLLSTVSGKMQQIDNKVDSATQAVPQKIRQEMEKTIHVDEVNGHNNNDGSSGSPINTVGKALSTAPRGSSVKVVMHSDLTKSWDNDQVGDEYSRQRLAVETDLTIDLNNHALRVRSSLSTQGGDDGSRIAPGLRFSIGSFCRCSVINGNLSVDYFNANHQGLPVSNSPQDGVFRVGESSLRFFNVTCYGGIADINLVTLDGWANSRGFLTVSSSQFNGSGVLRFGALGGRDRGDIWMSSWSAEFSEGWTGIDDPA